MTELSPTLPVGDIAADLPGAAELFRRLGISFCCGGNVTLAEAAARNGLAVADVLAALQELAAGLRRDAPNETLPLIDHILSRYHETHRTDLHWLIPLAQKVETVHGDHEAAPLGLTEALLALRDDLESHMMKEEQVLFPMMRQGGHAMIAHPIAAMRHEHDSAAALLGAVERVTHGLTLPEGACGSWTALYTGLRKFSDDLRTHVAIENDILFPRFEPAH
ncbi:iron-sulfur cluster repair di-iron protein [Gemmobacter caeruleus]|uniref:iron-sulfur cluster repair di-iron protein n=1 Tax=Gemmobacter caeruleus TaxID=2595004 RepID=UPI0011ED290A|nr:iron-sulfur cluster repair di-iron protein [Gemmobacter caeruleus]